MNSLNLTSVFVMFILIFPVIVSFHEISVDLDSIDENESESIHLSEKYKDPLLWNKMWGDDGNDSEWIEGIIYLDGYLFLCGNKYDWVLDKSFLVLMKMSLNGTVVWTNIWEDPFYSSEARSIWTDNISIYTAGCVHFDSLLVKWDIDGNQVWNKTRLQAYDYAGFNSVSGDGSFIYTVGDAWNDKHDLFLFKWDADGTRFGIGLGIPMGVTCSGVYSLLAVRSSLED